MVSSAKMLEKTGTPSGGHPTPVVGWQKGEEYFRRPTSVMGVGVGTGYRRHRPVRQMQCHSGRDGSCRKVKGTIFRKGATINAALARQGSDLVQVEARLRIGIIQIVRSQQPMPLGTNIGNLHQQAGGHLALDIEVILIGVL